VAVEPSGPLAERAAWIGRVERRLKDRIERIPAADCSRLAEAIVDEATAAKLDPALILAIIEVESGYDLDALSHRGASGLMQLIPSTFHTEAARSRLRTDDLKDPVLNVRAGVRYYRRLLGSFRSPEYALMAYNAGPQRISGYLKMGKVPDRFRDYPRRVFSEMRRVRRSFALESETLVAENLPRRARRATE
jgi:soluble lytic murein transglycosylase-like protein